MALENNIIDWNSLSKQEKYAALHTQWNGLMDTKVDLVANLSNATALMKTIFQWWWVGFYRVDGKILMLAPFQGPPACTTIELGKGVCGSAWQQATTLVVPDVDLFPGHIACSSESKSEIVIPIHTPTGEIWGVLDVDSEQLSHFDAIDQIELEKFCRSLEIIL
jgi:GAF domain-containing protein